MPRDEELLRKTYELARANNKMLRSMRRAAFWGTVFKLVLYAALLGIPVWLYFQFVAPVVSEVLGTAAQLQQAGNAAQGQLLELQNLLNAIPGVDFSGPSQ